METDRFITPAKPALPPSMEVLPKESHFESDFFVHMKRIMVRVTKINGKPDQNDFSVLGFLFTDSIFELRHPHPHLYFSNGISF